MSADQKIITGAHVILFVNGERFGSVYSFALNIGTPSKKIGGIDVPGWVELATTMETCSGTMGVYRLIGDGGAEGAGLVPVSEQLPRGKYFSMQLIERTSDTTVFSTQYARVEDQKWAFEPKSMTRGNIIWEALGRKNEAEGPQD